MLGAHQPREAPLESQQKRTFCLVGPELLFVVYFPLKGLFRLHQGLHVASSPQLKDWLQPKVSKKLRGGRRRVH